MQLSLLFFASCVLANNWATYPQVPKTASINGFADPIIDFLPDCAKECVKFSTGNTPCPYWDTGCFCVMPQWAGLVGQCVAEKCKGKDVQSATSLATSLCSKVGANTWIIPKSIETQLSTAAGKAATVSADVTSDSKAASSDSGSDSGASAPASETSSASSDNESSSSQAVTSAPDSSSAASSAPASGSTSNGGFLATANMAGALLPIAALLW